MKRYLSIKVVATILVFIIIRHQVLHWFVYPMKESKDEKAQALEPVARACVNVVIAVTMLSYVLGHIGIDVAPIFGFVVGMLWVFGKYFDDILGGFVVLLQNRFDVGDIISVDGPFGLKGKVVTLGYRGTTIEDEDGVLWTVRNADLYDRVGVQDTDVETTEKPYTNGQQLVFVPGVGVRSWDNGDKKTSPTTSPTTSLTTSPTTSPTTSLTTSESA